MIDDSASSDKPKVSAKVIRFVILKGKFFFFCLRVETDMSKYFMFSGNFAVHYFLVTVYGRKKTENTILVA